MKLYLLKLYLLIMAVGFVTVWVIHKSGLIDMLRALVRPTVSAISR